MPNSGIVKGGFVHFDSDALMDRVVGFQFNPETLVRTLVPLTPDSQRRETIQFTLELDATDALEQGDPTAGSLGIHPSLAALEMLLQKAIDSAGHVSDTSSGGTLPSKPFTLFVWGSQRIIPIKCMQLEIHETMFDGQLNPLRATATILLEILSEAELSKNPRAKAFMDSHLKQKESLARQPGSSGLREEMMAAVKNKPSE